ncbi:MAG: F0F1 ATP synthase subunit gamma [Mycoplasmatales bacterium]|nr:F0F1 ATP synthase subunit gamma [Mycoplasmatales bacterium]
MASLQEIKNRVGSISTTKKITKAMQLVATAKLQKAKGNLEAIQEYYTSVYDMFQDLLSNVKDLDKLFPKNGKNSTLYILISSDIGLCGGYNSNVLKLLKSEVKENDKVIGIGNKGINSLKSRGYNLLDTFPNVGDEINYLTASEIGKLALAHFQKGESNKVKLIHTKFINSVTFEATISQLLPIIPPEVDGAKAKNAKAIVEFEPDPETVLINSLPLYISAVIFGSLVESKVSEMSSRRTAMENATENATDLIDKLNLEYNRARQAAITQEITEIVAGADGE